MVAKSWLKTLETIGQQTISIIAKQKLINRRSIDPTSFLLMETGGTIIWEDAPEKTDDKKQEYMTIHEFGSIFHCWVEETLQPHETGWSLNLNAYWTRSRDFAPFPNKAMKATKRFLTNPEYLRDRVGTRLTNKSKKTKRGRNYRSRVRTIQEALLDWSSQFDEHSIHVNGEIFSEQGKKKPKTSAFIVIEPSHLFSDVYRSKRMWFIRTSVRFDWKGC